MQYKNAQLDELFEGILDENGFLIKGIGGNIKNVKLSENTTHRWLFRVPFGFSQECFLRNAVHWMYMGVFKVRFVDPETGFSYGQGIWFGAEAPQVEPFPGWGGNAPVSDGGTVDAAGFQEVQPGTLLALEYVIPDGAGDADVPVSMHFEVRNDRQDDTDYVYPEPPEDGPADPEQITIVLNGQVTRWQRVDS